MSRLIALLVALTFGCGVALAAPDVPREPVLRIETGSHLSLITRISSDDAGNFAVTSSEDKTARVWDLRSGQQMSVLRPPLSGESVGALYAVAMSPDGRQVAAGGNAAFDNKTHSLYLFDRSSGSLPPKSTLSGIEAPITQLAWSADSQLIAVGLRQEGLRVFKRNLGFVGADPEYNDAIYGAAFSRDGRLAVAGLDGSLRIYGFGKNGLERLARKQMPGKPYSVAWSPDGSQLAVGLQDAPRVVVLSAGNLEVVHTADAGGSGNLGRVAWSPDGKTLFAAGSVIRGGRFAVLAFAGAGRESAREIGSFGNTVTGLASHAGGLLASSAEPAWASFDESGASRFQVGARNGDFRDAGDAFRVGQDGQLLAFPMLMGGKEPVVFDLAKGELRSASAPANAKSPTIPSGLSDWKNSATPKINGQPLALLQGETSRSAAAMPDGSRFALGSEWYLRLFTQAGAQVWEKRTPGAVWGVNVSGDGRWVVAALGDGSLRWYRASDGQEQLALFVHGDHERWIAWTPTGYYDTSMGGENLVGWHVNRAFNQSADFFSVGRFRERFYQPSVIQKVMQLADEGDAVRAFKAEMALLEAMNAEAVAAPATPAKSTAKAQASAALLRATPAKTQVAETLPPIIELQSDRSLESNDGQVTVRYAVRTPADAPLKEVKVRVNGKLERNIKTRSTRSADGQIFEAIVPVPPKDSDILLIAENRNAKSDPVTVSVRRPTAPSGKQPYVERYDTLYMLVVAVNKYAGQNALQLPVKDANDFRRQMTRIANAPGKQRLYDKPEVKILIDEDATQDNIREGLKWLRDSVKERDAGVIFLAGHGMSQDNSYYYVPYRTSDIGKKENWVPGNEIVNTLQNLPGRAMFFLDTCHSGALANQAKVAGTVNQVDEEHGVIVFASATAKELAQETDEWGNGAFTKALIEGLRGEAEDPRDKFIYPTTLKRYVTRRVRDLTDNQQRPYVSDHGIDDPIAVVVK
jgi:WD40 repeat protein